jgi:phenylpropionate dioxygenase-like ring-hydroxylating dioxygenase large terminal subunit
MAGDFLRNCWYQAAWAAELDAGSLARTILDERILFFRKQDGGVAALQDRCPHRFAPLSAGRIAEGVVTCGYHGLAFSSSGQCVNNPYGPITEPMKVRSFPAAERHSGIWIWMGDPNLANDALIPDLSFIDETPDTARNTLYIPTEANYQLACDNIMDLTHTDYLHPDTLGGPVTGAKTRVFRRDGHIVVEWVHLNCVAPGLFQRKVPSPAKCDFWIEVSWQAPGAMVLSVAVVPEGQPRQREDVLQSLHNMTPETGKSTHYFMCGTRKHSVDDVALSEITRAAIKNAFLTEDKPMVEAQQKSMGDNDFWALQPLILSGDAGAIQARRELAKLISAETAAA